MPKVKPSEPAVRHRVLLCRDACPRIISAGYRIAVPLAPLAEAVPECLVELLDADCEIAPETRLGAVLSGLRPWRSLLEEQDVRLPAPLCDEDVAEPDPACGLVLRETGFRVVTPIGNTSAAALPLASLMAMPVSLGRAPNQSRLLLRDVVMALAAMETVAA